MINLQHEIVHVSEWTPDLRPDLPNCPTPVIEKYVTRSAIEACERANIWRWDAPEMPVTVDQDLYQLLTPIESSCVHSIVEVLLNNTKLTDCSYQPHSSQFGANVVQTSQQGFHIPDRGYLQLTKVPSKASDPFTDEVRNNKGLFVSATFKPERDSLELPKVLHNDYYDLILKGAMYRLMDMVDQEWTNHSLARKYKTEFEIALNRARQQVDRGFTTGTQRIKPRKF